jgi:gp16 family phage-associated protein
MYGASFFTLGETVVSVESVFDPIPKEALRNAKARLALDGDRVEDWAVRNGFNPKTVHNVLGGRRLAIRGQSLKIAVLLGLRPDPSATALQRPSPDFPAGHTVGKGPPVASSNRRPELQLGEPAR